MSKATAPSGLSSGADPDVAARLKTAVRLAGGNKAVAARSGLKLGSLNNYLRSVSRMPAQAASQAAKACNVSIDWLLSGEGPMEYLPAGHVTEGGFEVVQGPTTDQMADTSDVGADPEKFFTLLDVERMAEAIGIAEEAFAKGTTEPDARRKAQVFALIYDFLGTHPPDRVRALIDLGPIGKEPI